MVPRRLLQNDLEPLLSEAGLSGAAIEVLLNLALGPANFNDLKYNAKLLPGENVAEVAEDLLRRKLIKKKSGGDDRMRLVGPDQLEMRLPEMAGRRLAHLARRASLDFVPAVNLNPALPEESNHLGRPFSVFRRAFRQRLPQVEFKPQTVCNMRCLYCYIRKDPRDSLDMNEIKKVLRRNRSAGISKLILTGGEPTMRKDLPEIIGAARLLGFEDVQLFTNGLMFAYRNLLDACVRAGLTSVCLHVSSIDRTIYRRLTGLDRLDTLLEATRNLARCPNLEITLLTVVNRLNLGNISETVAFFRSWQEQVRFSRFVSQLIFCCVYSSSWDHRDEVLLPMEDTLPIVEQILSRHRGEPWPIMHQGFPYCLLPGHEALSYDLYFTFARQLLPAGDFDFTTLDTMFLKPRRCLQCVHEPYCLGISRGYARLYGTDMISPERAAATM